MRIELEILEKKVHKINNSVPYINMGGCGFFALYLHKKLLDLGVDNSIKVIVDPSSAYGYTIKRFIKNFAEGYTHSFAHVMLYIKGIGYLDSYGVYDKKRLKGTWLRTGNKLVAGNLPASLLEESVEKGFWTYEFDRKKHGKKLIKKINKLEL